MAENLTVTRVDGILDVFAAVNIGETLMLRHAAIEPGGGAVISNDILGSDQGLNLVDAAWRDGGNQLYVRAFFADESIHEWVWGARGWEGPNKLK
jgi:hypothetical protein